MKDIAYLKLKEIEKLPQIYVGDPSLHKIRAYISGYLARETEINVMYTGDWLFGFQKYVQSYYSITSDQGWDQIIDFFATSDKESVENFFKRVDEYHVASENKGPGSPLQNSFPSSSEVI